MWSQLSDLPGQDMNPCSLQTAKREHLATTYPVLQSHFGCQTTETAGLTVASHCRAGLRSKPAGPHPRSNFQGRNPSFLPRSTPKSGPAARATRRHRSTGGAEAGPGPLVPPHRSRCPGRGRGRGARRRPEGRGGGHHERQERPRARPARSLSRLCAAGPGADMAAGDRHSRARARSLTHSY